jgi:tRNA1(Val) A37 N6-methylase TrmN6
MDVTDDKALGGRLTLRQPKKGHRFGHDAILLAACVPAAPGDTILDFGAGVGTVGLAVLVRVPQARVWLVEKAYDLDAMAMWNIGENGLDGQARAIAADVTGPAREIFGAGVPQAGVDHVVMNPPFHDPVRHQSTPEKQAAHQAGTAALYAWFDSARRFLKKGGSLTVIVRADRLHEVLEAFTHIYGGARVLPVHPGPGKPAIRVIVQARRTSKEPLSILPGLFLADEDGQPTAEAEAILRDAQALVLA